MIAKTIDPPYVMAVFTSIRTVVVEEYDEMKELTFAEIEKMMVIWDMKYFGMKMVLK